MGLTSGYMQVSDAGSAQRHARGDWSAFGRFQESRKRAADPVHHVVEIVLPRDRNLDGARPEDIKNAMFYRRNSPISDGDESGSFGSAFSDLPALQVAGENVIQVPQMLHPLAVDDAACMGEHKDGVPPREPLTSVC